MDTLLDCPVCLRPISDDNRGMKVTVRRRRSPKHAWLAAWRLGDPYAIVCQDCATAPRAGADGDRNLVMVAIYEYLDDYEPAVCEQCSLPILLKPDKRRKRATCSEYCRVKLAKAAKRVPVPVTLCEVCGAEMSGRADRRTCSSACRQKSYRQRAAS